MTIEEIIRIEPELKSIIDKCDKHKSDRWSDKFRLYTESKRNAFSLVGHHARDSRLRNEEAYKRFEFAVIDALDV